MSLSRRCDQLPDSRIVTALLLVISACGGGDSSGPAPDPTPRVTAVSVTPSTHTMAVGDQMQFNATVNAVNGASTGVSWATSNASVATVSSSGLVQAVTVGSVTITATSSFDATKSGTASITVNPKPAVNSVAISPTAPVVVVGQSLTLTATVSVVGGASTAVTWSTSNASIVSVSPAGAITGVAVGNANVTATSTADPTKSATVPVVVNPVTPAVQSVVVTPANPIVVIGNQLQLTANVTAVGGASTAVTWSTSNAAIATVSPAGQVSGVAQGNATITATSVFDATKAGTVNLTVSPPSSVVSVSVSPPTLSLTAGGAGQLTATVTVTGSASQGVVWSSSNTSAATVSQTGTVTGVAAGSATIRATAQADATKFGESVVTVTAPGFPSTAEVDATINNIFSPGSVDIIRGGSVTWNFQAIVHNVTFNVATGAPADINATSSTSVSRTFNTSGTFDYQCTLHGGMTGRVIVH